MCLKRPRSKFPHKANRKETREKAGKRKNNDLVSSRRSVSEDRDTTRSAKGW
jgi:hypothetical protein